jgi:hypothetical protein
MIRKELVAASAEPLILSLLGRGESYGYAIIQEIKARSGGELQWTDGMLYPVLHRMEHRGLIKARWGSDAWSANVLHSGVILVCGAGLGRAVEWPMVARGPHQMGQDQDQWHPCLPAALVDHFHGLHCPAS